MMKVTVLRFFTLLLAALSLTMESAHVLEMPQKMAYDERMYAAVNTTLYRYFAIVGGAYQVVSIVLAFILVLVVRGRRPSFAWTLTGAVLLLAAFSVWLAVVEPVNLQVADAINAAPESAAPVWTRLKHRWEMGHAAGFILQLLGFAALLASVLVETRAPARPIDLEPSMRLA